MSYIVAVKINGSIKRFPCNSIYEAEDMYKRYIKFPCGIFTVNSNQETLDQGVWVQ